MQAFSHLLLFVRKRTLQSSCLFRHAVGVGVAAASGREAAALPQCWSQGGRALVAASRWPRAAVLSSQTVSVIHRDSLQEKVPDTFTNFPRKRG